MLNPCTVKGIDIFLGIADRMIDVQFAAVPGWGTTTVDLDRLSLRPNITIVPPNDDIYSILATTKVLLFPSLWDEAFGRTIVEAMLCGVPVIASHVGGTAEAKLGVPYLIPVRPIERFLNTFEGRNVPKAVVPEQDLNLWINALHLLLHSASHYNELKDQSASVAREYVASLHDRAIDTIISDIVAKG
jgi:glycosyltransferase involved in cell wall biosynthesis